MAHGVRRLDATRIGGLAGLLFALGQPAGAQALVWWDTGDHASDALGWSTLYLPDVDGDGVADLLLGAPGGDGVVVGKAKLYSGATRALIREFVGDTHNDNFGRVAADLDDVDGDGLRDYAFAAPNRSVPGALHGAIFVVSGTGTTLRTITSTTANGQVGWGLSYVGDVDGDGVRELLYDDSVGDKSTVYLTSGKTGATIRTHIGGSKGPATSIGRAGDVDADGVDDYMVCRYDGWTDVVYVYSGATGVQLYRLPRYALTVGPAGDLDVDGHADLLLSNGYDSFWTVSGATGQFSLPFRAPSSSYWSAVSPAGDIDGDGHPDLAAAEGGNVHLYSGATGLEFAAYVVGGAVALDATADVDGDGVTDLLAGIPFLIPGGVVNLVSGANGSNIATLQGESIRSNYGIGSTVVSDRDGDGWRDVAIVVPGGLTGTNPGLVQIVSGQDGHELSHFQTTNTMYFAVYDRQIVSIGDVDGDGVSDLAVICAYDTKTYTWTDTVELRSGANDALITTIIPPSGHPSDLAAAVDLNGKPLLAISTTAPGVYVYDLTTMAVVTSYLGFWSTDVACVGDVDGDGHVDWFCREAYSIYDPWRKTWGVVRIFSGRSGATLWVLKGTSTDPIDFAATAGDLDGDGIDEVLTADVYDNSDTGKVTAWSIASGAALYTIAGTQPDAYFGSCVAPIGDVNGDGSADFAIGARGFDSGTPRVDALFIYSGATAALLHRFDAGNSADLRLVRLANQQWRDAPTVDPDAIPDLVVNAPTFEVYRGRVDLRRLDDLMLQVDPPSPAAGQTCTLTTRGGPAGNLAGLFAIDLGGTPLGLFLALGTLDAGGSFEVSGNVPVGLQGLTLDVVSFAIGFNGKVVDSEETAISFQ